MQWVAIETTQNPKSRTRAIQVDEVFALYCCRPLGVLPMDQFRRNRELERKYAEMWRSLFSEAHTDGSMRADLDPELARLLVIGSLNWATEWWTPQRGSLDLVVATAQSIIRHGISAPLSHQSV